MSIYHIINLKETPETSRIGQKWTNEEEEKFIGLIGSGKGIEEIAKEHQRTVGAMKIRRGVMAVNMLKSKSMEEVCNLLQVTQEDIEFFQKRLENRQTNTRQENITNTKENESKALSILYQSLIIFTSTGKCSKEYDRMCSFYNEKLYDYICKYGTTPDCTTGFIM